MYAQMCHKHLEELKTSICPGRTKVVKSFLMLCVVIECWASGAASGTFSWTRVGYIIFEVTSFINLPFVSQLQRNFPLRGISFISISIRRLLVVRFDWRRTWYFPSGIIMEMDLQVAEPRFMHERAGLTEAVLPSWQSRVILVVSYLKETGGVGGGA